MNSNLRPGHIRQATESYVDNKCNEVKSDFNEVADMLVHDQIRLEQRVVALEVIIQHQNALLSDIVERVNALMVVTEGLARHTGLHPDGHDDTSVDTVSPKE